MSTAQRTGYYADHQNTGATTMLLFWKNAGPQFLERTVIYQFVEHLRQVARSR